MATLTSIQLQARLYAVYCGWMMVICIIPLTYYIDTHIYKNITREDHWVEYLTAFFLLVSAVIIFNRMVGKWKDYKNSQKFGLALMGTAMFLGFGEEISWVNAPDGLEFPTDLRGAAVVISIEPSPDDSAAPFFLKPLFDQVPEDATDHTVIEMDNYIAETVISGSATRR